MGVQFPQFADKEQGLAQGISQGMDVATRFAQIGQMGAEKRKREWEMGFQKAAYAMANASNPNFADETREKFLQKGVAPFLNDPRWGFRSSSDPEFQFTAADLKNEAFLGAVDKIKGLMGDKDLSEKEKMLAVKPLILEMRMSLGQDVETAKMFEEMVSPTKKQTSVNSIYTRKASDGLYHAFQNDPITGEVYDLGPAEGNTPPGGKPPEEGGPMLALTRKSPVVAQRITKILDDSLPQNNKFLQTNIEGASAAEQAKKLLTEKDPSTVGLKALGFYFARMSGSNSQLSDAEREVFETRLGAFQKLIDKGYKTVGDMSPAMKADLTKLATLIGQKATSQAEKIVATQKGLARKTAGQFYTPEIDALFPKVSDLVVNMGVTMAPEEQGAPDAPQIMTATNPKTGEKLISRDGGKTWEKP